MTSLATLQEAFREAVYGDSAVGVIPLITDAEQNHAARVAVYRNNVQSALQKNLEAKYPAIRSLVDPAFFRYAAHEYIRRYPSRSGNLDDYGQEMGEFLRDFLPTQSLGYLPDIAAIEWALHKAYGAADVPEWDSSENGVLCLAPSVTLLHSAYPIERIYKMAVGEMPEEALELNAPTTVLVYRAGFHLMVQTLEAEEYLSPDGVS